MTPRPPPGLRGLRALARAYAYTAGAAALRRGLPVFAGLFAAAGLLFGGNGIQPETIVEAAVDSPVAGALLWASWLTLTQPTLAALWRARESLWLRSLPAPRAWHLAALLAMSTLAESPWVLLWALGGGPVAGLAALGGALAGHAALLARPPGLRGLALPLAALLVLAAAPPWSLALGTWPIALLLLRAAWLAAPTHAAVPPRGGLVRPRVLALAQALLLGVARGHAPTLLRGALLAGLSVAAAWLAARNNALADLPSRLTHACGFLAPAALLAGSAAAGPMLALEDRARWLLTTAAAPPRLRLAALVLASAALGAALGLLAALALAGPWQLGPADLAVLAAATTLAAAALTALAALAARASARLGTRGPGRLVLALFAATLAALAALAALGPWAPAAWLTATAALWFLAHVKSKDEDLLAPGGSAVLLTMASIRKRLGTLVVLDGLDLTCARGELALILGHNGAGKSTLLRIAAGIVEPDAGEVRIGGSSLANGSFAARSALGFAPDTAEAFPDLSIHEFIALVASLKQSPPPSSEQITRLGLDRVWRQRLRTLSFGQVKRTWLLAATVGAPPLWLLDEPSNGLDPDGVRLLAELLREHADAGGGALVTTNDAAFADLLTATRHRLVRGRLERGAAG